MAASFGGQHNYTILYQYRIQGLLTLNTEVQHVSRVQGLLTLTLRSNM